MVVHTCNQVFGKLRQEDYFEVKDTLENIAKPISKKGGRDVPSVASKEASRSVSLRPAWSM